MSAAQPTEEELRAYEEELSRITSTQLVLQATASLLNVGGHRLGLAEGAEHERDLEQVRDAVDAVMALMPIVERRMPPAQARPLREALSQLQLAYARACQADSETVARPEPSARTSEPASAPGQGQEAPAVEDRDSQTGEGNATSKGPGPAERSGKLWVPDR